TRWPRDWSSDVCSSDLVIFYAAAALPQNLWDRIKALKPDVTMLSAWGSTETSPLATSVHFRMERPGVIGLPVAECELKLVPTAEIGRASCRERGEVAEV